MLTLFRRIRRTLVSENRFSKYLVYAVGEIVLVVIGILIALQINNWNNESNDRKKEAIILKQIHSDFKSNKKQLDSIVRINQKKLNAITVFIDKLLVHPDSSAIDTLIKYSNDIYTIKTFNPSNGAVEALINSSSFELIQNDSLRNLLVSWQDVYEDYAEEEQLERKYQLHYFTPFLRKNINFLRPYSKLNLETIKTVEFQNTFLDKRLLGSFVLEAIEEEKINYYIDEIVRLSKNDD
ncbi:MAG: DUF6090 family protein [Bacteroidota bacterium]|nr:DUF6090 family protein [uncultured Allomuricauda sp.]